MKKASTLKVRKTARDRGDLDLVTSRLKTRPKKPTDSIRGLRRPKRSRADELKAKHMDEIAEKSQLVAYMRSGMSANEALACIQMREPRSISWAQKLFRAYQRHGPSALIDRRWERVTKARVMTTEVKRIVDFFLLEMPAAGPRAIWKEVCKECRERRFDEPSYSSVKQYIASLPEPLKVTRKGKRGLRQWDKEGRPVIRYENTTYSNERWQIDDCHLPIWGRRKESDVWKPCYVFYTGSIDCESRSIPGCIVSSRNPDAWAAKLLLRKAILPKSNPNWGNRGVPSFFQTDNHKNFTSSELPAAAALLGIVPELSTPKYPNSNGKEERFHRTINEGCLKRLPGHMEVIGTTYEAAEKRVMEFLPVPQIRKEIEGWIVNEYHQTVHSETGRKPAELWEETVRLRMPENEEALNLLLLHTEEPRTVRNVGIEFAYDGVRHTYWGPELMPFWKRKVRLRFNPDDMESALVYCATSGEFICEAWDMRSDDPRYTIADIKRHRSQFRMGLVERLKNHFVQIEDEDRPLKAREMFKLIREDEARKAEAGTNEPGSSNTATVIDYDPVLLQSFKAQRRGELNALSNEADAKEENDEHSDN